MMLNDKDVQKKPEQGAGEAEQEERKLIWKKLIGNYYRTYAAYMRWTPSWDGDETGRTPDNRDNGVLPQAG